jgi:hypothetical protein
MTAFLDSKHCKRPDLWPLMCLLSIEVDFSVAKNCFLRKKMLCRKREYRNVTSGTNLIVDKIILRSIVMFCCRHGDHFSSLRSVNVVPGFPSLLSVPPTRKMIGIVWGSNCHKFCKYKYSRLCIFSR